MSRLLLARKFCTSPPFQFIQYCIQTLDKAGFGNHVSKAIVLQADNGNLVVDLKVEEEYLNSNGSLHCGFSATLVDTLCTYALMTHSSRNFNPSVVANMHLQYFLPAVAGDEIRIDIKLLRVGRVLGFMDCEIRNKATNELLVKASHTQAAKR